MKCGPTSRPVTSPGSRNWCARDFTTASCSPDSGDSQFFICFDDASFLNNQYTVWGKVTSGMENVDKIKRGEPVQNPDKIVKARMALDDAA